jgi:hypothetical protein
MCFFTTSTKDEKAHEFEKKRIKIKVFLKFGFEPKIDTKKYL